MQDNIVRGPLAVGFIVSNILWGLAGAVIICQGGMPIQPEKERYYLNDHGQLTEVTRFVWIIARVCDWVLIGGWGLMLILILSMFARKLKYDEDDPRRNCAIPALISVLLSVLLPIVALAMKAVQ